MKYDGPVTVTIECVTPDQAAKWLQRNTVNRNLSKHTISRYMNDMKNDAWVLNGETIAFYEDGELKDGQHRLTAIVNTQKPQWMIVVRGISKKVAVHDRGRNRTTTDIMTVSGFESAVKNTSTVGAVKFLFVNLAKIPDPTDDMVMSFSDKHGEILASAYTASCIGKSTPICRKSPIIAALFCAMYGGVGEPEAYEFCKAVNTGFYNGEEETAAIVYRDMVLKTLYSGNDKGRIDMFYTGLKAISDYNNGIKRDRAYKKTSTAGSKYADKVLNECFKEWRG